MKTTETLIHEIASLAARDWYSQAIRNPYGKFYLWSRLARPGERIALPIVTLESPGEDWSRSIQISNAWTKERAATEIARAMQTLPILGKIT